jgi:antirestriction protein ArdC
MKPCTVNDNAQSDESPKQDIYARITAKILAALEDGVRPWVRPWNAEHAAGPITRPLRHNGQPYTGINILSLWASASVQGFAAPIWMTYRQAVELRAHVRKGEKGSPVVYANSITRTETDTDTGVDVARDIHFLKGYTVFNVEQIDGLPAQYTAPAAPGLPTVASGATVSVLLTFCTWSHTLMQNICRRVVCRQRLIYYRGRSTF